MSTPELQLHTLFVLDGRGRITSTREPAASLGPLFFLVRSATACAWAVRADVSRVVSDELDALARQEPPVADLRQAPVHAQRYTALVSSGRDATRVSQSGGPAFTFPDALSQPSGIMTIEDEAQLRDDFRGWLPGEIAAGRAPVLAVVEAGPAVSLCFCAWRSDVAAEAGLHTAEPYRRRGFGARASAAWALAIRASGRVPLYSTAWTNESSLAVARSLGLFAYACDWSLLDPHSVVTAPA